jgi:serine protease AprX
MKKWLLCLLAGLGMTTGSEAQTRYIVRFKDKATNPFSLNTPANYLSSRAISRRTRYGIALDSTDLPVTPRYVDSVRLAGAVTVLNVSKWLNAVTILTSDAAAISWINSLPFVQSTRGVAARMAVSGARKSTAEATLSDNRETSVLAGPADYGSSFAQVRLHHGDFLYNIGLRGQGMIISLFDGGFQNYLTLRAFDSARAGNQILGTWDFVANEVSVNEDNQHGTQCFSTIAGNVPGQLLGTANKAGFFLFRSEDVFSEYPIEEFNWVCAAERADSSGSDLISSSLGYNTFDDPAYNYTYADMNGNTTMAALGADLAAKKGILVANSAGNEGNSTWGKIATPADGDSVLAVGAVNSAGVPASFTSRGPSSDGQVKPDVASHGVGTQVQYANNVIAGANGTSFACPNMAGLAASLWQAFPEVNNMRIIQALRQSGSRATNPNDTIGYGIPDMRKAFMGLLKDFVTASATAPTTQCRVGLTWQSKDAPGMVYLVERRGPGQSAFQPIASSLTNSGGTSFGIRTYTFTDSLVEVPAGTISYRIRQVLDTASATFFSDFIDTVSVNSSIACIHTGINPVDPSAMQIQVAPNPVGQQLVVRLTLQAPVNNLQVRVVNSKGQQVRSLRTSAGAGAGRVEVPMGALAAGRYFVSLYNGDRLMGTREFIKL